jgi:hypothetical protein
MPANFGVPQVFESIRPSWRNVPGFHLGEVALFLPHGELQLGQQIDMFAGFSSCATPSLGVATKQKQS